MCKPLVHGCAYYHPNPKQDIVALLVQAGGGGIASGSSDASAKLVRETGNLVRYIYLILVGTIGQQHHARWHHLPTRYVASS